MIRTTVLSLGFVALAAVAACESETGPDAPPRTNGCIDTDCQLASSGTTGTSSSGASDAGADAK
jgi:hypothetical protein